MLWTFLNNLFVWYLQTDQIVRVQTNQTMVSRNEMFKQIKKDKSKALLFNKNNQLHKDWTRQDGMTGSSSAEVDLGCVTFHRFNTIHAMLLWWFKQYTVANKNKKRKRNQDQHTEIGQIPASYIKFSFSYIQHCCHIRLSIMFNFKQE